jgi:hypothetical protein
VDVFGPLTLNDNVELNSHNLVTTGQVSASTVVAPTLTTTTATTVDIVTDMLAASTAVAETCIATYADVCGAVDISRADVATCTGTRDTDSSDCAVVAAFVSSGLIADCPTSDGCTFTAATADQASCLSAADCAYAAAATATCTGTRTTDSSNCADVAGFDGSAATCPTDDACVYTAAVTEACTAIAAPACAAADISGVPSASQTACEAAGACTYTRGATGKVDFASDVDLLTNSLESAGRVAADELVFNGHLSYKPIDSVATVVGNVRDSTGLDAAALATVMSCDESQITEFTYNPNLATATFTVTEVRAAIVETLVEYCVAADLAACAAADISGDAAASQTACEAAGACTYTAASTTAMCGAASLVVGDETASGTACAAAGTSCTYTAAVTEADGSVTPHSCTASPVVVETCIATDAAACATVNVDGNAATCTGAGAGGCVYTPALGGISFFSSLTVTCTSGCVGDIVTMGTVTMGGMNLLGDLDLGSNTLTVGDAVATSGTFSTVTADIYESPTKTIQFKTNSRTGLGTDAVSIDDDGILYLREIQFASDVVGATLSTASSTFTFSLDTYSSQGAMTVAGGTRTSLRGGDEVLIKTTNTAGENPINIRTVKGDVNVNPGGSAVIEPSAAITMKAGTKLSAIAEDSAEVVARASSVTMDAATDLLMYAGGSVTTSVTASVTNSQAGLEAGIASLLDVRDCSTQHSAFCTAIALEGTVAERTALCQSSGSSQCVYTAADPAATPPVVESCALNPTISSSCIQQYNTDQVLCTAIGDSTPFDTPNNEAMNQDLCEAAGGCTYTSTCSGTSTIEASCSGTTTMPFSCGSGTGTDDSASRRTITRMRRSAG